MHLKFEVQNSNDWIDDLRQQFGPATAQDAVRYEGSEGECFFSFVKVEAGFSVLIGHLVWGYPVTLTFDTCTNTDFYGITVLDVGAPFTVLTEEPTQSKIIHFEKNATTCFQREGCKVTYNLPARTKVRLLCMSISTEWIALKLKSVAFNAPSSLITISRMLPEQKFDFQILFSKQFSPILSIFVCEWGYRLLGCMVERELHPNLMNGQITPQDYQKLIAIEQCFFTDVSMPLPSLELLARESGMSLSKFKKTFTLLFGNSPYEYYLRKKLESAAQMLLKQKWSVTEIALNLGYKNVISLNKAFKSRFQLTPSEYLKSML